MLFHFCAAGESDICSVANRLLQTSAGRKNGQDARWLQQVRRSGTTSDKVAALTLLLQESAVANLKSLDALLNWVIKRKGGRNVVAQVCVALCLHTSSSSSVSKGAAVLVQDEPAVCICEIGHIAHCEICRQCTAAARMPASGL